MESPCGLISQLVRRKRNKQFAVITARDLALMRFVAEQKYATREQLARRFFPRTGGRSEKSRVCYRRILRLMRYELIESRTARLGGKVVYQVARAGMRELERRTGWSVPYLSRVDGRHFEHDL
jgi:hypothetical protein